MDGTLAVVCYANRLAVSCCRHVCTYLPVANGPCEILPKLMGMLSGVLIIRRHHLLLFPAVL